MGGGDLLNLLIERDIFEESFTRFYVAEASHSAVAPLWESPDAVLLQMILCIEQCHKHGFIHRDIKPDVGGFLGD
jgi:serine/threonine protein kinase